MARAPPGSCHRTPKTRPSRTRYKALIQVGWARPDSRFRRVFTTGFIPDATEEQMRWLDDLQRMATSTENAVASREGRMRADARHLLPQVQAPTLGLYARGDHMVRFESGLEACASIPNARLVPLDSSNHILLADEPAWPIFLREVGSFMAPDAARLGAAGGATAGTADLTSSGAGDRSARRERPHQHRDRGSPDLEPAHRRAPPLERLPEAQRLGQGGAHGCRRERRPRRPAVGPRRRRLQPAPPSTTGDLLGPRTSRSRGPATSPARPGSSRRPPGRACRCRSRCRQEPRRCRHRGRSAPAQGRRRDRWPGVPRAGAR